MITGTVFLGNQAQAVRLTKVAAFADDVKRVSIRVEANGRTIGPGYPTLCERLSTGSASIPSSWLIAA